MKSPVVLKVACGLCVAVAIRAADVVVKDLGPGIANDINSSGHVAGTFAVDSPHGPFGFLYDGTQIHTLSNSPPGFDPVVYRSEASALNDLDEVGGTYFRNPLSSWVALYRSGEYQFLGANFEIHITGINIWSAITGYWRADAPRHEVTPFYISPDRRFEDARPYMLSSINSSGVIAGSHAVFPGGGFLESHRPRAMIATAADYLAGNPTYIDTRPFPDDLILRLDGDNDEFSRLSDAYSINDSGEVVGAMLLYLGGPRHAFRYRGNGLEDLGTLGGRNSTARDINSRGDIVGESQISDGMYHAFKYSNGVMVDLNSLLPENSGWELLSAKAINDRGEVVGHGRYQDQLHAYVLSPAGLVDPPQITEHPAGVRLGVAQRATVTVTVAGPPPFTYRWTLNGTNIANATNATYTIESASASDEGDYRVFVSNAGATVPSRLARVAIPKPELMIGRRGDLGFDFKLSGVTGAVYRIEFRAVTGDPGWTVLTNLTLETTPQEWTDPDAGTQSGRLYRALNLP